MVLSDLVHIWFRSEGNFSFAWGNQGPFFASPLAGGSLASSGFLEGCPSELLVLHNLRSYVIGRGDGGRENFNTRKKVDNSSKGHLEGRWLS